MKAKKLLTVYLDSSDYSALSAPNISAEHQQCLKKLNTFSEKWMVKFLCSCSLISEMLPLSREHLNSAKLRIRLMNTLCKSSLIDHSSLIKEEINKATLGNKGSPQAITTKYGWFPSLAHKKKPDLKYKFPKGVKRSQFNAEVEKFSIEKGYPLKLSSLALGLALGAISEDDMASDAVYESRDIEFLLKTIEMQFEFSAYISKLIREPSLKFHEIIKKEISEFKSIDLSLNEWNKRSEEILIRIANDLSQKSTGDKNNLLSLATIQEFCPGITTAVLSSYSSMRDSFKQKAPRAPKPSDLADSLHALYAPYVDIFRADKYMSAHIKNSCPNKKVEIVNNLLDVPEIIDNRLSQNLS